MRILGAFLVVLAVAVGGASLAADLGDSVIKVDVGATSSNNTSATRLSGDVQYGVQPTVQTHYHICTSSIPTPADGGFWKAESDGGYSRYCPATTEDPYIPADVITTIVMPRDYVWMTFIMGDGGTGQVRIYRELPRTVR